MIRTREIVWVAAAISVCLAAAGEARGGYVTTVNTSGGIVKTFNPGVSQAQYIRFVTFDTSGNLWIARGDLSYTLGQSNPNDAVVKYSPTGQKLLTVKGPMRNPTSIAFDSGGNIYVGGTEDGAAASLSKNWIYKYTPSGAFDSRFQMKWTAWLDLAMTTTDRLYGSTNNPASMVEMDLLGGLENSAGSIDGKARQGSGIALAPDENSIWQSQTRRDDTRLIRYDMNLNVLSNLSATDLGFQGGLRLETRANGNLVVLGREVNQVPTELVEISPAGVVQGRVDLAPYDMGFIRSFVIDADGNYVIAHDNPVSLHGPASITWDSVVNISTTAGAEDLVAGGDILLALNVGEAPGGALASIDVTNSRETITFAADRSIFPKSHNSSVYSKPTGNADLDNILNSHSWKPGGAGTNITITIDGLTPGLEYFVQAIVAADDRGASGGRTQTLSDDMSPANISDPMMRSGVGSVVGRFTAAADWQTITLAGDKDPGLSLLLVRQVPAPAAFWLLAPGLALLKRRRK